jgi:hypothetical protein
MWCSLILSTLKDFGFQASAMDPCLLFKQGMMVASWVDDIFLACDNKKKMDDLLKFFESRKLKLTMETDLTMYLGISVKKNNKSITLTQPGLIDRIIEATNMQDCRPNAVPASLTALGSDSEGDAMEELWSYRSVVGMLLYLSTNTRPDIALAVSQVA